ncbi:MAG TPA: N-acetylmuramoyl-L-alanine amidase [Micromonosporaceae bacterium]|nr:N-acetylmuramoyl-L-alanine amidase [Micromonosporaceae bacterium]
MPGGRAFRRGRWCWAGVLALATLAACAAPGSAPPDRPAADAARTTPAAAPSGPALSPPAPTSPASGAPSSPALPSAVHPLAGVVVVVDPGHNGANAAHPEVINRMVDAYTKLKPCDTTGTRTDDGYPEHAFNWDTAVRLAARLRVAGALVVLTRSSDTGVGPCLDHRAEIGNRYRAVVAVSIHGDGAPAGAYGFHVLEPALVAGAPSTAVVAESHRLAVLVRDELRRVAPPANYIGEGGINTRDDMGGLNLSRVPKVMVECGNMRNARDAARMKDPAFRERVAAALAAALTRFVRDR